MNKADPAPLILAMTGASGSAYGVRLLECLLEQGKTVYLVVSDAAHLVLAMETDWRLPKRAGEATRLLNERYADFPGQVQVFAPQQWMAPIASGSGRWQAMIVCPCTTGTLAAIASGHSDHLIDRAADVSLKEKRLLILVVRETPFSLIHIENMRTLTLAGAVVMPANPGFYHQPQSVSELVDFMVARILDQLHIDHHLLARWGEPGRPPS